MMNYFLKVCKNLIIGINPRQTMFRLNEDDWNNLHNKYISVIDECIEYFPIIKSKYPTEWSVLEDLIVTSEYHGQSLPPIISILYLFRKK